MNRCEPARDRSQARWRSSTIAPRPSHRRRSREQARDPASGSFSGRLRDAVRRDLGFLINATHLSTFRILALPVRCSFCVEFRDSDLAGRPASSHQFFQLSREVCSARLSGFRTSASSEARCAVNVIVGDGDRNRNTLHFEVVADLWCNPAPVRLRFRAELIWRMEKLSCTNPIRSDAWNRYFSTTTTVSCAIFAS